MPSKSLPNAKSEIKRLGYEVVHVPDEVVGKYVAAYNIVYKGKHMKEPKYDKGVDVPPNQVWVSEKFKVYDKIILFHELQEWKYRSAGYDRKTAHLMAKKAEEEAFGEEAVKFRKLIER